MPQGKISDEAWSAQKDVIVTLFVEQDVTLDQLVSIMHDKGFQASKGQLARHLKNWKVSKNLSERQWKTAIKIIKRRERDSRQSEFWFRDRRLPLAKVRKAIQRYDLPRLRLSGVPSPSPEPMADIRVCTPPRSPSIETTLVRQSALRLDGLDGANRHPFPRGIILDGLPFLQFRQKLEESASLWLPRGSMQIWGGQILQNILPVIGNLSDTKPWQSIPEVVSNFPIPLRTLDSSSDSNSYLWLIEFMVIGSTNGLLRPCRDRTLDLLIDTMNEVEVLDQVLALIGRYEFYGIIEKILDLGTISSALFGARALLSSIALEDERLLEILLSRGVPLDGTRNRSCMSAIHLAVEQQNEKIIRRLLKAGIDPDGYTISDDDQNKPLSDLLFLFSIKKDYRVTQISQAIVDLILLSRSNVYSAEECASYWTLLFLQSWVYDATQFLDALCNHYHRSATLDVGVLCKTHFPPITEEEDFNDIAHKILVHVPLPEHEHLGPVDWLMGAIRRRDLSIVEILRHRYPDAWLDSLLGDSFDEDAINWLLQSPIDVSMKLGNFFVTACRKGSWNLYQSLLHRDPQLECFRYYLHRRSNRLYGLVLTGEKQILSHLTPQLVHYGICSWDEILDLTFLYPSSNDFSLFLAERALEYSSHSSLESMLGRLLGLSETEPTLQSIRLISKCLERRHRQIDWSQFRAPWNRTPWVKFLENDGTPTINTWAFNGGLTLLHELIDLGVPLTKTLFTACARGRCWARTLPFLINSKPSLASELTDEEILCCLLHEERDNDVAHKEWSKHYRQMAQLRDNKRRRDRRTSN